MNRHDALAPLSRDHRRALSLAEGLKRDGRAHLRALLPGDTPGRVAHLREAFERDLAPHFAHEEQTLHPATEGRDAQLDVVWKQVLAQHAELRRLLGEVGDAEDPEDVLDQFGHLVVEHVRLEERELFPRCEQVLDDDELERLGFIEAEAERAKACDT